MPITLGCSAHASSWSGPFERLLGGPMRMHADRAPDVGIGLGDRHHLLERVEPGADRLHDPDAGGARPGEHAVPFLRERRKVQMAVAVDQHRHLDVHVEVDDFGASGAVPKASVSASAGGSAAERRRSAAESRSRRSALAAPREPRVRASCGTAS